MASNVELYNAGNDSQKTDDRATIAGLQGLLNRTAAMASDARAGMWNGMVNVAGVIVNLPNGGPFASRGDPGYVSLDGLKKPYKSGTSVGPDTEFWTPVLATLGLGGKAAVGTGATTTSADAVAVGNGALKAASGDLSAAGNAARTQPYGNGASASPSLGTATTGSSGANVQLPMGNGGIVTSSDTSVANGALVSADAAQNIVTAKQLAKQLQLESANSPFTTGGTLTPKAISDAQAVPGLGPGQLANPNVPAGFGKYTTQTYQSPAGSFQMHFYMNPTTGEVFYGLDYKAIFNNMSGVPKKP
ncbi:hypothetical protein [Burkholderia sp. BDU5]|uniref:hypothetical protein n=1 Tax=Burkholderia sp. BDU5 TaxID=1385590 RepID=UPI000AC2D267|nr:hypothetical protein [Burkholderia sp. BDU5]